MDSYRPYGDEPVSNGVRRLHRWLERVALVSLCVVSGESALCGIVDAGAASRMISFGGVWNETLAYAVLLLLYTLKLASCAALGLKRFEHTKTQALVALLATNGVDWCFKLHAHDLGGAISLTFLAIAAFLHVVDALSTRRSARVLGSLDGQRGGVCDAADQFSGWLRDHASRYKVGAIATFVCVWVLLYTAASSESFFGNHFRRELAKAQWTRAMALCAMLCALGSNDTESKLVRVPLRGLKKSL